MLFNNGGMLTGAEIEKQIKKGNIAISPYDEKCLNPNSYNLKLHPQLLVYERNKDVIPLMNEEEFYTELQKNLQNKIDNTTKQSTIGLLDAYFKEKELKENPLDMKSENKTIEFEIPKDGYVLQPGIIYIGRTVEETFTDKFIPMINGRSSGGRLGISIHVCAGFGDIGFKGTWTLEITVVEPVKIYPYEEIAQVCFFKPYGKVKNLYNGRYNKQIDATASRFYLSK